MVIGLKGKTEAITPPETISRLLAAAGVDLVLVGGQALAFWVLRYGLAVPVEHAAISSDTDFLAGSPGDRSIVERLAAAIDGQPLFPSRRAMTALVGQAVRIVNEDEFVNVDVIDTVIGIDRQAIQSRAVRVDLDGTVFLVMHPLHVLQSRLANIYKLKEKQNAKGEMQLAMSIDVAREFIRAKAGEARAAGSVARSPIQSDVSEVERMALEDAGRKVARRTGICVADAIDPSSIPAGPFWDRKWQTISRLMSPGYASRFTPPQL